MKSKELASKNIKDLVLEAIDLVKELEKKEKHVLANGKEETITDEQINTKYISGFCGTLAMEIKILIEIIYQENHLPKPNMQQVKFDLPRGWHMYLKFPNPNTAEKDSNLYADISGVYTLSEVQERNKEDIFAKANDSVNSGETPKWVVDRKRDERILEKLSYIFLKRYNALQEQKEQ